MADRTSTTDEGSREEFASYFRDLADAFEGDGGVDVPIENETITLHAPEIIEREIRVEEGSSMIGSDSERLTIEADWTPGE